MIDSNHTRLFRRWWQFIDDRQVNLTDWQSQVAVAYLTETPILVQVSRGRGQSFIHHLLREFEASYVI